MIVHHNQAVPLLSFHRDHDLLAVIALRPYAQGDHVEGIREVLEVIAPYGPSEITFASTGRAWSALDPIPPVCQAGDLRTRVMVITHTRQHDTGTAQLKTTTYLWPLEECFTDACATILHDGAGPVLTAMETGFKTRPNSLHPKGKPVVPLAVALAKLGDKGHQLVLCTRGDKVHEMGL